MASLAFGPIIKSIQTSDWETAEAVVLSSYVGVPHQRQYVVRAEYEYIWQERKYKGQRVFFDEMVGVRKAYYYQVSRDLLRHKTSENPLTIWLDPDEPQNSVIYPEVRWDKFAGNLLFFVIWAAISAGLAGAVIAVFRK